MKAGIMTFRNSMLRHNWHLLVVVFLFFALGFFFGIAGEGQLEAGEVTELTSYLDSFLNQLDGLEAYSPAALKITMYNNIAVIFAIYLLGLTVIGIPVVLALIFARGFALGFTVAFLTSEKSFDGIVLALVSILPQNIFYVPALVVAGAASLSFALVLIRRYFDPMQRVWPSFANYTAVMLLVLTVMLGAGMVEAYLSPALLKLAASFFTQGR